ncbi:hypothetical protein A9200_14420 [Maribacter hydrothermalis]|uniref:Uncharacterized protein n=1 Tax=Maribacter hydrothermalis TaxID=1836467 RepID=A0A1B7ZD15_9FLAO|nr:hypothetical protein A9200_14420 [Maribacter hydrothermalis]
MALREPSGDTDDGQADQKNTDGLFELHPDEIECKEQEQLPVGPRYDVTDPGGKRTDRLQFHKEHKTACFGAEKEQDADPRDGERYILLSKKRGPHTPTLHKIRGLQLFTAY